jgi:3-hydroxyisobutyrate dehydrogenase-like beta-hydroxyacid dehydrogenase
MLERIAFIGVGRMGGPMAARLLAAGHNVTVFDTSKPAVEQLVTQGARGATSAVEAASGSAIVMVSLPSPAVLRAVAADIATVKGVSIFVDLSTSGPAATQAAAATLAAARITLVDAPVSGGVKGAASGKLTLMVSGEATAVGRAQPLLENFGRVIVVGDKPGLGQTLKLANNLMSAASLAIASEAMAMGVKAGLDPAVMLEVINASSGRNSATQDKIPRHVLNRKFDFGFANALSFKDVRLCLEEAEALGVPMVVGAAVRQMLSITQQVCGPDADVTDMVKVLEGWSGCQVGSSEEK